MEALKKTVLVTDNLISRLISYVLIFSLILLILAAFFAMIFRQLQITNTWLDPLARHLVLVSTFLGASHAVTTDGHIKIDIVSRMLEKKPGIQFALNQFCHLIASAICLWLCFSFYDFFMVEKEFPTETILGLQSYHLIMILPLGMILVAVKMISAFFANFFRQQS
jgi:TRAP-type C4-dicarboxylate transport system permease small subunit